MLPSTNQTNSALEVMVIRWRVLRSGLRIAIMLTPAAVLAVALLGASNVEPVTAADVILDGFVVVTSAALTLGLLTLLFILILALFSPGPWAESRQGHTAEEGIGARWAILTIWITSAAGLIVSLSVALPGWFSVSQGSIGREIEWRGVWWILVATTGFVGSLALIVPLLHNRVGCLSGGKGIAAAFITPAVLFSALQIWHEIAYVPAQLEASITVEPSLRFGRSENGTLDQGIAEFSLRNGGDTGTRVLISNFLICPRRDHTELKGVRTSDLDCIQGTPPIANRAVIEAEGSLFHRQIFIWGNDSTVVESLTRIAYARGQTDFGKESW